MNSYKKTNEQIIKKINDFINNKYEYHLKHLNSKHDFKVDPKQVKISKEMIKIAKGICLDITKYYQKSKNIILVDDIGILKGNNMKFYKHGGKSKKKYIKKYIKKSKKKTIKKGGDRRNNNNNNNNEYERHRRITLRVLEEERRRNILRVSSFDICTIISFLFAIAGIYMLFSEIEHVLERLSRFNPGTSGNSQYQDFFRDQTVATQDFRSMLKQIIESETTERACGNDGVCNTFVEKARYTLLLPFIYLRTVLLLNLNEVSSQLYSILKINSVEFINKVKDDFLEKAKKQCNLPESYFEIAYNTAAMLIGDRTKVQCALNIQNQVLEIETVYLRSLIQGFSNTLTTSYGSISFNLGVGLCVVPTSIRITHRLLGVSRELLRNRCEDHNIEPVLRLAASPPDELQRMTSTGTLLNDSNTNDSNTEIDE